MKNYRIATFLVVIIFSTILTNCQTSKERKDEAQVNFENAEKEYRDAKIVAEKQHKKDEEEWMLFVEESEERISKNEELIEKLKLSNVGGSDKIKILENKNADLKNRMDSYNKVRSDWAVIKTEFNQEIEQVASALNDLSVNTKY